MYVRISNTGVGFTTYQEQVSSGMTLNLVRENYYILESVNPTPEEICEMFGYVPVAEAEVYPPTIPPTLEELKQQEVDELNSECRLSIEAGFSYDGKLFKSAVDPDQTNIALAGLQFVTDPSAVLPWETADNQVIMLTAETFPLFAGAFGQHKMSQQVKVSGLKAQVNAATTPEEVASVTW